MPRKRVQITRDVTYMTRPAADTPKRLVVLLHGYQQRASTMLRLAAPSFGEETTVLAPDGPWPVPYRVADRYEMGYSWYFFDPKTEVYGVPMEPAIELLTAWLAGIEEVGSLPITVVGFSQGGYLAPFLGRALDAVDRVVGINCRFRSEVLTDRYAFRLDALAGAEDPVVDPDRARGCHEEIISRGNRGRFVVVPGAAHRLDSSMAAALTTLADES